MFTLILQNRNLLVFLQTQYFVLSSSRLQAKVLTAREDLKNGFGLGKDNDFFAPASRQLSRSARAYTFSH